MRALIPATVVGMGLLVIHAAQSQAPKKDASESMDRIAAKTYEDLATAIIAIEATEDDLVRGILTGYHAAAQEHLAAAAAAEGPARRPHLEAAAAEIGNIANEGDGPIRAIRQRLAQAGHTHNTDVETKEDYMFITNREKAGLLALAQKAARLDPAAPASEVEALADQLGAQFRAAIAPE